MLEKILKSYWLEKRPRYAFNIGIIYSIISIVATYFIFPKSQGIASIAFLSMLLLPSLNKMFITAEKKDCISKKFSVKKIFKDHNNILRVYFMLFLGIFFTYALFSLKFPNLLIQGIFNNQLRVIGVNIGQAVGGLNFYSIFTNNLKIVFIFLVLSLIFGAGTILFLAWNASVWGVVFGYIATQYTNVLYTFISTILKVTPHMLLEAGGYIFAILAGGLLSQAMLRKKFGSDKFNYVLKESFVFITISVALIVVAALVEVYVYVLL